MKILAIGAHPDDVEFGCAPILIKESKKGNQVKILVLSRGEAGTSGTPESREQEARNAAKIMGVEIEFLDLGGDCHIEYNPENIIKIAKEIRDFKPDTVIAPHTGENQHPDHFIVGKITREACRFARFGGLAEIKGLPVHKIQNLFFYTITQNFGELPDIIIDISEILETWEAAMNSHKSQMASKRYLDLRKTGARLLGLTIGTEYAAGLYKNDPLVLNNISDITLSPRNY